MKGRASTANTIGSVFLVTCPKERNTLLRSLCPTAPVTWDREWGGGLVEGYERCVGGRTLVCYYCFSRCWQTGWPAIHTACSMPTTRLSISTYSDKWSYHPASASSQLEEEEWRVILWELPSPCDWHAATGSSQPPLNDHCCDLGWDTCLFIC